MFRKRKVESALTFISYGTKFIGEIHLTGDALISGEISGSIFSENNITLDPEGIIEGETRCKEIKIAGHFKGKLNCDRILITRSGTLDGEVTSNHMEIYEGGQFIGVRVQEKIIELPQIDDMEEQKLINLPTKNTEIS